MCVVVVVVKAVVVLVVLVVSCVWESEGGLVVVVTVSGSPRWRSVSRRPPNGRTPVNCAGSRRQPAASPAVRSRHDESSTKREEEEKKSVEQEAHEAQQLQS